MRVGIPGALFSVPSNAEWDVTADGKRFLVGVPVAGGVQAPFTVVLNWTTGLRR